MEAVFSLEVAQYLKVTANNHRTLLCLAFFSNMRRANPHEMVVFFNAIWSELRCFSGSRWFYSAPQLSIDTTNGSFFSDCSIARSSKQTNSAAETQNHGLQAYTRQDGKKTCLPSQTRVGVRPRCIFSRQIIPSAKEVSLLYPKRVKKCTHGIRVGSPVYGILWTQMRAIPPSRP